MSAASDPAAATRAQGTWSLLALLAFAGVFGAHYAFVRPTNFGGMDEWLCIDLESRGIIGIPYANRPFVLFWAMPAAVLWPHSVWAYWLLHGLWLTLGAWCFALLVRRVVPWRLDLAFLAGLLTLVWVPSDFLRLDPVLLTNYSGFTFGAVLAVLLFVESYFHRSTLLLVAGGLVAAVNARGFEGTLPLMAAGPLLLAWSLRSCPRRFWTVSLLWSGLLLVVTAMVAWSFLGSGAGTYQTTALKLDLHPVRIAGRILEQFGLHLGPLVMGGLHRGSWPGVILTALAFLVAAPFFFRGEGGQRRVLLEAMAVGALLAAFGYLPLMLSASILKNARTEFLAAPGIGLLLASGCLLVSSWLRRNRRLFEILLVLAVVSRGAERTLALQAEWDEARTRYPDQHAMLSRLLTLAPGVARGTLFLLLDGASTWQATFPLRHAVRYLYAGDASAQVVGGGASDFLYPLAFGREGVLSAPWPVIRRAWDEPVRLYRYEDVVVLRSAGTGQLEIVEEWPEKDLGASLPSGAQYAPRLRLLSPVAEIASRRLLETRPPVRPGGNR